MEKDIIKKLKDCRRKNMPEKRPLVIIGGGPGGYVAALRAAQLKQKVLLIELDRIGGTCMNYGCIPTKFLLHQTRIIHELRQNKKLAGPRGDLRLNWALTQEDKAKAVDRLVRGIEFLLERCGVQVVKGEAALMDERQVRVRDASGEKTFEAEKIILATGSRSAELPFLKPDGKAILASREALELANVPKSLIVVGAGAIGIEMGTIYARLGTEVKILEIMPTLLPGSDLEMVNRLERILRKQGLQILTQMRIEKCERKEGIVVLSGTCLKTNSPFAHQAEKVLMATGRKPNSEGFQTVLPVPATEKSGFVKVDSRLETTSPGIYAIGDLIGGKLLAHKASHEGLTAAENTAGGAKAMDYRAMPMAVFTDPEFASVGLTEEEARAAGIKTQIGVFSLQASGRALTMEASEGMVKVIAGPDDKVIGGHIIAPNAGELIAELTLAIRKELKLQDVASTIHIHPTLSETVMEAALKAKNEAIHILNT
jgi:dihydrolipoamide dehydrogenase